ncbi:MAG: hypothetical protein AAGI28_00940 [Pseudomonadota bacterium]
MRLFVPAIVGMALSACSTIDTGVVDYRRAELPPSNEEIAKRIEYFNDTACRTQRKPKPAKICAPLLGSRLFRKNTSLGTAIGVDDVFSIRLDHGFMQYVSEFHFTPSRLLDANNPFVPQAEIVVLARAFEFSTDPNTEVGFVELAGESSLNEAKVIYYSPDVEHRQALNFSNIPLLGPAKYSGNPVGIQLIVLELDRVSDEMKGLLDSLASLGQSSKFLGQGAGADALLTLGKSLLENNNDDIIFSYRFVLDHSSGGNNATSAGLEEGRYVLRRITDRRADQVWRNLELDHNTGQLFLVNRNGQDLPCTSVTRGSDAPCVYEPYRDETYFTLNIFKNTGSSEASYIHQETLGELNTRLKETLENRSDGIVAAKEAFDVLAIDARSTYWAELLTKDWESVSNGVIQYARFGIYDGLAAKLFKPDSDHTKLPDPSKICFLKNFDAQRAISAELDIIRGVGTFVDRWSKATEDKVGEGDSAKPLFAETERSAVLRFASTLLVNAGDVSLPPELRTTSAFESKYITAENKPIELQNAVFAKAKERLGKSCDELVVLGQASRPTKAQEELIALAKSGDQAAIDDLVNSNVIYEPLQEPASTASQ